jgi:flavin reductase (DIM6/NTAB) family NADH-FMN oxidoreductase RutF
MKKPYSKTDLPVGQIRKYLEPGPIVLVSSSWRGKSNIMTMGWHTVMEFSPSLIGCFITSGNHSYKMIEKSGECVINIPTVDMIDTIIGIGNTTGQKIDKFKKFKLTPEKSQTIHAPGIKECYANFECRVVDKHLLPKYNFFILEVLKAQVASRPRYPKTVHYRGEGVFMVSGKHIAFPEKFLPQNL